VPVGWLLSRASVCVSGVLGVIEAVLGVFAIFLQSACFVDVFVCGVFGSCLLLSVCWGRAGCWGAGSCWCDGVWFVG